MTALLRAATLSLICLTLPASAETIGARYEIYALINELATAGKSILLISSDWPEVLGMADRIVVMHDGRVTGEIADARNSDQRQIMELAVRGEEAA